MFLADATRIQWVHGYRISEADAKSEWDGRFMGGGGRHLQRMVDGDKVMCSFGAGSVLD